MNSLFTLKFLFNLEFIFFLLFSYTVIFCSYKKKLKPWTWDAGWRHVKWGYVVCGRAVLHLCINHYSKLSDFYLFHANVLIACRVLV